MADTGEGTNSRTEEEPSATSAQGGYNWNDVIAHMKENKIESGLWLTRICSVLFSILFVFPITGGNPQSYYQKALISNAATSALRLHQRLPNFQLSREFFTQMFQEDSCHYLFFSLILMTVYPMTMALVPIFLFALLHASSFSRALLNKLGPNSLQLVRNLIGKLDGQQVSILRFIACTEIFIMPTAIFMIFTGRASLLFPFLYFRFLSLRYTSRRNPYCRTLFWELRVTIEHLVSKPQCPQAVRNLTFKGIAFVNRLAPQVIQQPQQ